MNYRSLATIVLTACFAIALAAGLNMGYEAAVDAYSRGLQDLLWEFLGGTLFVCGWLVIIVSFLRGLTTRICHYRLGVYQALGVMGAALLCISVAQAPLDQAPLSAHPLAFGILALTSTIITIIVANFTLSFMIKKYPRDGQDPVASRSENT
jgi:peptidoglycan/LPS O-acetylase OafA/YrhL